MSVWYSSDNYSWYELNQNVFGVIARNTDKIIDVDWLVGFMTCQFLLKTVYFLQVNSVVLSVQINCIHLYDFKYS